MKIQARYIWLAVFAFITIFTVVGCLMWSAEPHGIFVDGEEINGVAGFGVAMIAMVFALLAVLFVAAVTGVVLVGVALFLALLAVVVVGSVGLALSPLLLPLLLLIGIVWLLSRRKHA